MIEWYTEIKISVFPFGQRVTVPHVYCSDERDRRRHGVLVSIHESSVSVLKHIWE